MELEPTTSGSWVPGSTTVQQSQESRIKMVEAKRCTTLAVRLKNCPSFFPASDWYCLFGPGKKFSQLPPVQDMSCKKEGESFFSQSFERMALYLLTICQGLPPAVRRTWRWTLHQHAEMFNRLLMCTVIVCKCLPIKIQKVAGVGPLASWPRVRGFQPCGERHCWAFLFSFCPSSEVSFNGFLIEVSHCWFSL